MILASSIKSQEDHQTLISSCVNEIHAELDVVLKVLIEGNNSGDFLIAALLSIFMC